MLALLTLGALLVAASSGVGSFVPEPPPPPTPTPPPQPPSVEEIGIIPLSHRSPETWDNNLRFERIDSSLGLSQNSVLNILQDHQGFMWFGTQDGLNRFDGHRFTVYRYNPDALQSLSDNTILSLYEDSYGVLWAGTQRGGLNRFERHSGLFTHYRHDPQDENSLSSDCISAILEDRMGVLWVGTCDAGLNRLDFESDEVRHFRYDAARPEGIGADEINFIYEDREGRLWIGTGDGLDELVRQTGEFRHYRYDLHDAASYIGSSAESILEDQQGILWIGTSERGLERLDPQIGRFVHFPHKGYDRDGLGQNHVSALLEDHSGMLWAGTDSGVDRFDRPSAHFIHYRRDATDPYSLSSNQVTALYQDRSGAIWVGTSGGGINRYNPYTSQFTRYRSLVGQPYSLSDPNVSAILQDSINALWVGTSTGGLNRIERQTGILTRYAHNASNPFSLGNDVVTALEEDGQGKIWVGTLGGGLDRFDSKERKFSHFVNDPTMPAGLGSNRICALHLDRRGVLWAGTCDAGLDRMNLQDASFEHYRHNPKDPNSLSGDTVRCIAEDDQGRLYIGTQQGLNLFDPGTGLFLRYQHDPEDALSLGDNDVVSILIDHSGRVWVGTEGGGLELFDPASGTFTHHREQDGLASNVIYGILEDGNGRLWMSTNRGLSRFDPQTGAFKNFDAGDGLQGDEFNPGAAFITDDGEMFFGGLNGISAFQPGEIAEDDYVPPVMLTAFTQNGQPVAVDDALEDVQSISLTWPNNFFEFEFAVLGYIQPEKNQYAYMLDGFDRNWTFTDRQPAGRYTNLPGGTYLLRMRGSNHDGIWNDEGKNIKIVVVPPFWQSWWVRGLLALALGLAILGGYFLRMQSIQTRTLELEAQVRERTAALEQKTHALERSARDLEERNQEIDRRRQELEALYQADEAVRRSLQLDQVLKALVDVAVDLLKADMSAVLVWNQSGDRLVVRTERGFGPAVASLLSFERGEGVVGLAAERGEPVISEDALTDPHRYAERAEVVQAAIDAGVRSFIMLPIKVSGDRGGPSEVFGVFNVSFNRRLAFVDEDVRLFQALAQRAALAISNAQLYEQGRELAILEERNRLARDLHDSAKQKAFAALAQLGAAGGLVERDASAARDHLEEAESLVGEVLQEIDTIIQELHPTVLQAQGLETALREYAYEWAARHQIEIDVHIADEEHPAGEEHPADEKHLSDGEHLAGQEGPEQDHRLPLETEQAVYRIVQEALSNVARHSRAHKAEVALVFEDGSVQVTVRDDGHGFDMAHAPVGLGLCSMRERADKVGGQLEIQSAPGAGTRVRLRLPLSPRQGLYQQSPSV